MQAALAIFNCPKELVVARVGTPHDKPDPPPCHYLNRYPAFWKRMMETKNGQQPLELMSTHPADATRINQLENLMPGALEEYQKAIAGH